MSTVETIESEPTPAIVQDDSFQTSEVATVAFAHGAHDMFFSFIPTIQPLLMEKLSLSNAQAGLFTVFLQGPSLLQPVIGGLADRRNLRWLIILAPTLSSVMITLTGLAPNYGILALLMLVAGFSTAGFHSIAPVLAAIRSGKKLGRGMGFFMIGGEFGYGLGPLVAVGAVSLLGLRGLPWLIIFGVLCSVILYARFKNLNTVRSASSGPGASLLQTLKNMRLIMLPIVAHVFISSFLAANIINFLPTFLKSEGASLIFAGAAFSLVEIAGTVGVFFSSWISDRIGQRLILIIATLCVPVFALIFLGVQGWLQVPALILTGVFAFSPNPAFLAIVQNHFRQDRSLANGIYMAVGFVVRSIVVFLVGLLADQFGLRAVFTASAWAAFLAFPFIFLLPER
jgi:FSR family fosmidomycin resistance protein-like MFS transporter